MGTLSDEGTYKKIFPEVEELIIRKAVPLIKSHLSEEALLALWDENVGGFEYPMLKCKSILLGERGEFKKLPAIFSRMREICRGGLAEPGAEQHIAQVTQRYCLQAQ